MNETTLAVPNAILFVYDLANSAIRVPQYVPGQVTSSNASCVSIITLADVDGQVTVRLGNSLSAANKKGCHTVLEHRISTPGRRVAIVTSKFEKLLEVAVAGDEARLIIGVDDMQVPRIINIEAQ